MPGMTRGIATFVFLSAACTDGVAPAVPATLQTLTPPPAASTAGEPLAESIAVKVLDQSGSPLAGVEVLFSVLAGEGSVSPATTSTGSDGTARTLWTLGASAGENLLEARVRGTSIPGLTFRTTGVAGMLTGVAVEPKASSIAAIGYHAQLSAIGTDRHGNAVLGVSAAWTSLDPAIATVDGSGRVVAKDNGAARIVAGSGAAADTAQVLVRQIAATVALSTDLSTGMIGETIQLSVTAADSNGVAMGGALLDWSSSDTTVATVLPDGLVHVVGVGPVEISVKSGASASIPLLGKIRPVLEAGVMHTCALNAVGEAYCWGANSVGQLGDGSNTPRSTPTRVVGGLRFKSLSVGGFQACGLTNPGKLHCWGQNLGRFGDGTTSVSRSVPTAGAASLQLSSVSTGGQHTCGLTPQGKAYCWGRNQYGQLGIDAGGTIPLPVPVITEHDFVMISAGGEATCGIATTGESLCWGYNQVGTVGDGTFQHRSRPVAVLSPKPFVAVSTRGLHHSCGLTATGEGYCWGYNYLWELGIGASQSPTAVPQRVMLGEPFALLNPAWDGHGCGLTRVGTAYCWGNSSQGQLGTGAGAQVSTVPIMVLGGLAFRSITTGQFHSCGLTIDEVAYCWGRNTEGELGIGTTADQWAPSTVSGWLAIRGGS